MNTYVTGVTIKELRERQKLTQVALGEKIGVSGKTISKWETAKGLPDISLLQPLAQHCRLCSLAGTIRSLKNDQFSLHFRFPFS